MSNGRSRGRRLRLTPDLRGDALGLHKYAVSGRLFVGGFYWVREASFLSCFECFRLVVKGCWILSGAFSVSIEIVV